MSFNHDATLIRESIEEFVATVLEEHEELLFEEGPEEFVRQSVFLITEHLGEILSGDFVRFMATEHASEVVGRERA